MTPGQNARGSFLENHLFSLVLLAEQNVGLDSVVTDGNNSLILQHLVGSAELDVRGSLGSGNFALAGDGGLRVRDQAGGSAMTPATTSGST